MSDSDYALNAVVWAKMKGFSPWPGRIAKPPPDLMRLKKNTQTHCIFFFGTHNYAWIESANVKPYHKYKTELINGCKTLPFKAACREIESYIQNPEKFDADFGQTTPDPDEEFDKLRENDTTSTTASGTKSPSTSPSTKKEKLTTPASIKRDKVTPVRKPKTAEKTSAGRRASSTVKTAPKRGISHDLDDSVNNDDDQVSTPVAPVPPKRKRVSNSATSNHNVESSTIIATPSEMSFSRRSVPNSLLNRPSPLPPPEQPEVDMSQISQTLKSKNIKPSALTFGFLGLGIMGCGIVKNLINSGHKVVVWNRTFSKCRAFQEAGAQVGETPSDVVDMTDITFSCVADPQAAKDMVFGNCGILQASTVGEGKGYVEMTGIDSETSTDIADAICTKGGRYLEAQIQGSKAQAEEGTLIILAAGDRNLFEDCQTCFEAIGKNSYYLGDVGNASKMNLILQMIAGISLVGLAESMALADRSGLQQKDVLEILELTNMASPFIIEKGHEMIKGDYLPHLPLTHMQKDLRLALTMSENFEQTMPITATANEVFKHAKRLGYADHDASSVFVRAKF